jgi:hypothetical protein
MDGSRAATVSEGCKAQRLEIQCSGLSPGVNGERKVPIDGSRHSIEAEVRLGQ